MLPSFVGSLLALASLVVAKKPNVVFILTDDQDSHMGAAEHMPYLQNHIIKKGTTYAKHFCTVALCCPSRATLWSGRAAHNHNVTNVAPPYGGYPKAVAEGLNDDNLFLWMQDAGYNTYYTGKLYNFHSVDNFQTPLARGFNGSDFLLDPFTYQYWNSKMSHNGGDPISYAGQYSTDVIASKARHWLADALQHPDEPFFVTVAPIAPHSNWVLEPENNLSYLLEPFSAVRHQNMFNDYKIPRNAAYNAAVSGGVGWIKSLEPLNNTVLEYNDHYQRQRLRALQAVDEMLDSIVKQLDEAGVLEDTYIFYSTDNGYHISQHRMGPGKECGFDTDIHIPFYARGPGVKAGAVIDVVTTHTDVSSTILQIAGVEKQLDGTPMPLTLEAHDPAVSRREHASIEYWGFAGAEGLYGIRADNDREAGEWQNYYRNNTYKAIRLLTENYSLYYSVWCTNETEFYDLKADEHQLNNMAASIQAHSSYKIAGRSLEQILVRLDALVMVLKTCKDDVCVHPWRSLHADGSVDTLEQALAMEYDDYYRDLPKMEFYSCPLGYLAEEENQAAVEPMRGEETETTGSEQKLVKQDAEFDFGRHWLAFT